MTVQDVLLPVFVYVLLVYAVLGGLVITRSSQREASASLFAANFRNQFEIPVLFFAVVALVLIIRRPDTLFVVLEWLFVVARVAHVGIHVTRNVVPWRSAAFAASAAIVLILWLDLAIKVLSASGL